MDSCFSFSELSETKQNASCSIAINESEPSCVSANKPPETSFDKSTDCKVAVEPPVNDVKSNEEVGDLNFNTALGYLSQLLLEEDPAEKISTDEEELALLATEKAFHNILRQEYYSSPDEPLLHDPANQMNFIDDGKYEKSNDGGKWELTKDGSGHDVRSCRPSLAREDPTLALPIESITAQQIQKGVEEAMKFLPNIGEFFNNRESRRSISGREHQCKIRKNPYIDLEQLVGKTPKQIVAYSDEPIRNENFDEVLLLGGQRYIEEDTMVREIMQKQMKNESRQTQAKTNYAMESSMYQTIEEPIDLRSLLIHCSETVSANDHSWATQLIHKIRKHSSPNGDWAQRLAYYFADGLEARLAGIGSEIYCKMLSNKPTIINILKAYRMFIVACPFGRAFMYFANQTILNNISKHDQKVHIINYGITQGYQWPSFFEHFSKWGSTPPKVRMTIIKVPEPGFRPGKRLELIGRRLADYASSFNVPFEYEGISSKWENVKVEDLKLANDEVVIVNCIMHSEELFDEGIDRDSPRDIFLNTIRKIKPRVFIHGITNGSYNSPFFLPRFRSALLHYSCLFEMLDSNFPRDSPERLITERDFLIPKATNAIACEGPARVQRPETYKQWHARKLQIGLVPLSIDSLIKKYLKDFVRRYHHKEFVVDDDNGWLLLGWKGRILYALAAWKSTEML